MSLPLAITATGMVTGVGLNAPAACAAIRCAIDNFQETHFMDSSGERLLGCEVPMEQPWQGRKKLIKMAAAAITEVLAKRPEVNPATTPLLLCVAEHERPGRPIDDDSQLFHDLQQELGVKFDDRSFIIAAGHVSIALALKSAREMAYRHSIKQVLIAACDTFLNSHTLYAYEDNERLLTKDNSNGFIPAEAGAALLVEHGIGYTDNSLICEGLGFGIESSPIASDNPLKADGLTSAIKESLLDAQCTMNDIDFRITDISGDHYHFKEASLALSRSLKKPKPEFDIWHPADCIGEVGSAIGPVMLGVLSAACEKGYTKGNRILAHMGNDDGRRSALILSWKRGGA